MPLPTEFIAKYPELTKTQGKLFALCFELYRKRGLYELTRAGYERPLCSICSNRASCWPGDSAKTEHGYNDGVISLPHVGRRYRADGSGVVVLGLNFYDAAGLDMNISLAAWEIEKFPQGMTIATYDSPGYRGSKFAYRSTASAAVICRALGGSEDRTPPTGAELADTLHKIARLQTVKCSPRADWSKPSTAMLRGCPPLILSDELDILRPGHVLVFGHEAFNAVRRLPEATVQTWEWPLRRAHIARSWGSVEVWGLYHPAARTSNLWEKSQNALQMAILRAEHR